METNKFVWIFFVLAVVVLFGSTSYAQKGAQKQGTEGTITMNGEIAYMNRLGGYYFKGENPPEGLMIVNKNPDVLEKLLKSGKKITIEGHFTGSADHLFIEKIDGKKYTGQKQPAPK